MAKGSRKSSNKREIAVYVVILIVLIILALVFLFYAFSNYHSFRTHQNYFKSSNVTIESWMTPHTILRHFNISESSLFSELGISNTTGNLRIPLSQICTEKKLNCTEVVDKLNSMVK